ncbi:melanophilin [Tamandua tetradactyla]|uniref:melanophilin n=1 Tax=Tamandua tetradactyla TaxID=48850 RepID=UPI0040538D2B
MGKKLDLSKLTDEEAKHVWEVVQRDFDLRRKEEERLKVLRGKVKKESSKTELLSGAAHLNETHCARCLQAFRLLGGGRRQCLDCLLLTCRGCGDVRPEAQGWLCDPCRLARVVRLGSQEWYYERMRARFKRFGSAKVMRSLRGWRQGAGLPGRGGGSPNVSSGPEPSPGESSGESEQTDEDGELEAAAQVQPRGSKKKRLLSIHDLDLGADSDPPAQARPPSPPRSPGPVATDSLQSLADELCREDAATWDATEAVGEAMEAVAVGKANAGAPGLPPGPGEQRDGPAPAGQDTAAQPCLPGDAGQVALGAASTPGSRGLSAEQLCTQGLAHGVITEEETVEAGGPASQPAEWEGRTSSERQVTVAGKNELCSLFGWNPTQVWGQVELPLEMQVWGQVELPLETQMWGGRRSPARARAAPWRRSSVLQAPGRPRTQAPHLRPLGYKPGTAPRPGLTPDSGCTAPPGGIGVEDPGTGPRPEGHADPRGAASPKERTALGFRLCMEALRRSAVKQPIPHCFAWRGPRSLTENPFSCKGHTGAALQGELEGGAGRRVPAALGRPPSPGRAPAPLPPYHELLLAEGRSVNPAFIEVTNELREAGSLSFTTFKLNQHRSAVKCPQTPWGNWPCLLWPRQLRAEQSVRGNSGLARGPRALAKSDSALGVLGAEGLAPAGVRREPAQGLPTQPTCRRCLHVRGWSLRRLGEVTCPGGCSKADALISPQQALALAESVSDPGGAAVIPRNNRLASVLSTAVPQQCCRGLGDTGASNAERVTEPGRRALSSCLQRAAPNRKKLGQQEPSAGPSSSEPGKKVEVTSAQHSSTSYTSGASAPAGERKETRKARAGWGRGTGAHEVPSPTVAVLVVKGRGEGFVTSPGWGSEALRSASHGQSLPSAPRGWGRRPHVCAPAGPWHLLRDTRPVPARLWESGAQLQRAGEKLCPVPPGLLAQEDARGASWTQPWHSGYAAPVKVNSLARSFQLTDADVEEETLKRKLEELTSHISDGGSSSEEEGVQAAEAQLDRSEGSPAPGTAPRQGAELWGPQDDTQPSRTAAEELSQLEDKVAVAISEVQQAESEVSDIESRIAALRAAGLTVRPSGKPRRKSNLPIFLPRVARTFGRIPEDPNPEPSDEGEAMAVPYLLRRKFDNSPKSAGRDREAFERQAECRGSLTQRSHNRRKEKTGHVFAKPVMTHQP